MVQVEQEETAKRRKVRRVSEWAAGSVGLLVFLGAALYSWYSVEHTMAKLLLTMLAAGVAAIVLGTIAYFVSFGIGSLLSREEEQHNLDDQSED